jgi:predicted O-methyltransferase YrrM
VHWLEIGSWEGRSALWTAKAILAGPDSSVVCVDPWPAGWSEKAEMLFDQNTREDPRIVKMRGSSRQALPLLRSGSFHGCYIDGLHDKQTVLFDAHEAARLIKPGGIIIFDDYKNDLSADKSDGWGVMEACDEFVAEMSDKLETLFKGWQLITRLKGQLA